VHRMRSNIEWFDRWLNRVDQKSQGALSLKSASP